MMVDRNMVRKYFGRIRDMLQDLMAEKHTPHETAASFAIGAFVTILPIFIFGAFILIALMMRSKRIDPVGLFAPAVVFNPIVKTPIYGIGYGVGTRLLPVVPVQIDIMFSDAVIGATIQFVTGIIIVAAVTASISYVVVNQFLQWKS